MFSGTITNLEFLTRALPENQVQGFYVLWWETPNLKPDGKFKHEGAAFSTILELASAADRYPHALNVRNLFFCLSLQRTAGIREYSGPLRAVRNIANSLLIKVFVLDLDVKEAGYADTDQAMRELNSKCLAIGVPFPNVIIFSSAPADGSPATNSSLHCYWVLNRALTREEWLPIAAALKAAWQKHDLVFDPGPPTNICGILRPLGSLNRKPHYDPPRVSRLAHWDDGPDYDVELFQAPLASYKSAVDPRAHDPGREYSSDLTELADAIEYRSARGDYVRGNYFAMLELHFGLAHHVSARPELLDDARAIIQRITLANGRDIDINESRFEEALTRTADRRVSDDALTTPRSIFKGAYAAGWLPPHPEDDLSDEQRITLGRAKRKLWDIFREGHHREDAAEDAARLTGRVKDEQVLAALAPSLALHLARDDWAEPTILDAIELFKGHRDAGLVRWAQKKGRPHG
jgi:hypothetical protein